MFVISRLIVLLKDPPRHQICSERRTSAVTNNSYSEEQFSAPNARLLSSYRTDARFVEVWYREELFCSRHAGNSSRMLIYATLYARVLNRSACYTECSPVKLHARTFLVLHWKINVTWQTSLMQNVTASRQSFIIAWRQIPGVVHLNNAVLYHRRS